MSASKNARRFFGLVGLVIGLGLLVSPVFGGNPTGSAMTQKVSVPQGEVISAQIETFLAGGRDGSVIYNHERVYQVLKADVSGPGPVTFRWRPASLGYVLVTGMRYEDIPGLQPPGSGIEYTFQLTPEQARRGVLVSFQVYEDCSWADQGSSWSVLEVSTPGQKSRKTINARYTVSAPPDDPRDPRGSLSAAPAAGTNAWRVTRGIVREEPFSTAACQKLVNLLQSGDRFFAWRVPGGLPGPGEAAPIPVVLQEGYFPSLSLIIYSELKLPLEVRLAASQWANQNLPRGANELWVAFGVPADAGVTCPNFPALPRYTEVTDLTFDLSAQPLEGEDARLLSYVCTRAGPGYLNYACAEPGLTQLVNESTRNWWFESGLISTALKPGDEIALHYWLTNDADSSQTFQLAAASSLAGITWQVYPGQSANPSLPDLEHPLGGEISLAAKSEAHIHFRGTVPPGTPTGHYQHSLTLSGSIAAPAAWQTLTVLSVTADGTLPLPSDPFAAVGLHGAGILEDGAAGRQIRYLLTITNHGGLALTNLVLTDSLPAHTSYQSCTGCTRDGSTLTWNVPALEADAALTLTWVANVAGGLPDGQVISNSAYRVTADGVSADGAPVQVAVPWRETYVPAARR